MQRLSSLTLALALLTACTDGGELSEGADGSEGEATTEHCSAQADWPSESASYEDEVLTIINAHRAQGATCGGEVFGPTGPMSANAHLRCAARLHSADMAARDFFSHTNPDGESFSDRIKQTDYAGSPAGENIAQGQATPEAVMNTWMSSDGHCANIMRPTNDEIGVGYHDEKRLWTQKMGRK